ncbi:flavin reductase family protein [Butyrivibrio sp. MC2013]|uniref:flavin reductase family protein n=1 Tax=Butyrivibrio sp. MC2013 TaxID=1280686 RepID=UPI0004299EEA|nr:flavin reductase [Butyrivibrio sp. MC2013]
MHFFQPVNVEDTIPNQFKFTDHNMALVTAAADGKTNAMTVSWGGFGYIWNRYVATIYIRDSRYTRELLDATDGFSISFLNYENYRREYKYLGTASGRNEDKLSGCRFGVDVDEDEDIPYIDEAGTVILCRKLIKLPMDIDDILDKSIADQFYADRDAHNIYMGEVVKILVR